METERIQFPDWKEALAQAALPFALREQHRRAILSFLKYCKDHRSPATVAVVRTYLTIGRNEADRPALRWFFRAARHANREDTYSTTTAPQPAAPPPSTIFLPSAAPRPAQVPRSVPPPAARDPGGADWERDLILAVRSRGFLWRTEETYRMWADRFAQFLRPRSPYGATEVEVGAFLTALAVEQRAMPSTQRQALNALVFLMQEALHRQLGEVAFRRATPRRRVPTVLTPAECTRLFAALDGTTRLMAELRENGVAGERRTEDGGRKPRPEGEER